MWREDRYVYTVTEILQIADWFDVYIEWMSDQKVNWRDAAESKADFCIALEKLSARDRYDIKQSIDGKADDPPMSSFHLMLNILNEEG